MNSLKNFIAEHLVGTHIFEMAKSLDNYKGLVESMIEPITCHILLILKARKEDSDEFVEHWKSEIKGFFAKFLNIRLKTKNTYESKIKHIENVIYNILELNDKEIIIGIIRKKMFLEGYDFNDRKIYDDFENVIDDFIDNHLDIIIDLIARQDVYKIKEYINNL